MGLFPFNDEFITPLKNPSRRDGGTKPEALVPKVNSTTGGQATAVSKGLPFTDCLQSWVFILKHHISGLFKKFQRLQSIVWSAPALEKGPRSTSSQGVKLRPLKVGIHCKKGVYFQKTIYLAWNELLSKIQKPRINIFICSIQAGIQTKLLLTIVNLKAFSNTKYIALCFILCGTWDGFLRGGFFS